MLFVKMLMPRLWPVLAAVAASLVVAAVAQAADSGWLTGSPVFPSSSQVRTIAAHPTDASKVAAVVNNVVQISADGGATWTAGTLVGATVLMYDPVYPGVLYAGTSAGMRKSTDGGLTWANFGTGSALAYSVTSAAIDKNYLYSLEYDGANTQVYRFSRSGATVQLAFPTTIPSGVAADAITGTVYIGSASTLYKSDDYGANWSAVVSDAVIGSIRKIAPEQAKIWVLGTKGLFYSSNSGSSFAGLVTSSSGAPSGISTDFSQSGMDPKALVINHDVAYVAYRVISPYNSFMFFSVSTVGAISNIGTAQLSGPLYAVPGDMAGSGDTLWLAGDNTNSYSFGTGGLYRRTGLVSSETAISRPVLFVPGIMGSWQVGGTWELDPITASHTNLLQMLRSAGYADNTTLFTWAYDWRQGYDTSAAQLSTKIAQVKAICACSSIDLIGYSTGGLVARSYIQGSGYGNDVANLVLLGTPNSGTVEAYSMYQGGTSTSADPLWRLARWVLEVEAAEAGQTLAQYIQGGVPGIAQALPVFSYLTGQTYPTGHPANSFLTDLNSGSNLALLNARTRVLLVGSNGSAATLAGIGTNLSGALRNGEGDGSVLLSSTGAIANPDYVTANSHIGHLRRPSAGWLPLVVGGPISATAPSTADTSLLMLYVKSPVKLAITNPDGFRLSDLLSEISGAYYSGSAPNVQFMVIPQFGAGLYQVVLDATAAGGYTVGAAQIMVDMANDADSSLSGSVVNGQTDQLSYDSTVNSWALTGQTVPPSDPPPASQPNPKSEPAVVPATAAAEPVPAVLAQVTETPESESQASDQPRPLLPGQIADPPPSPEVQPSWWGWFVVAALGALWLHIRRRRKRRYDQRLRL